MTTIPFGINRETGKEVHIDDATKKYKYVCVACGQPLIVNDGPKLGKFFKHLPDEDCIRIKYGSTNFPTGPYKEPNDGVHQHFPEWMAYLRALKAGDREKAATLWDFEIPHKEIKKPENIPCSDVPCEPLLAGFAPFYRKSYLIPRFESLDERRTSPVAFWREMRLSVMRRDRAGGMKKTSWFSNWVVSQALIHGACLFCFSQIRTLKKNLDTPSFGERLT